MNRTQLLAEYIRGQARRRLDRVEVRDGGANARCALALFDVAAHVATLAEDDPAIEALAVAGCFAGDAFDPGETGERFIGRWHLEGPDGDPWDLLSSLPRLVSHPPRVPA
ncbi:hypothetical protein [Rhizohabitans arisaemae]|uniref:hypothetical protein n=1 Tax=Rhizohabitans arisaemae TaxID=2720610 RepID=UPI0024B19400|nr:hypothetical protein [Rhizohabitans arisaemae]